MKLITTTFLIADIPPNVLMLVLTSILLGIAVVIGGLFFQNRHRQMWHETARIALEKGQPLPPLPDNDGAPATPRNDERTDVRAGLICVATGVGLFVFLSALVSRPLGYVGAIPAFIGVALLLNALISGLFDKKNRDAS